MVDATLGIGNRGADVELRSQAERGSHFARSRLLTAAFARAPDARPEDTIDAGHGQRELSDEAMSSSDSA
jgi:hypothetical protein